MSACALTLAAPVIAALSLPPTAALLDQLVYRPTGLTWTEAEPLLARLCRGELPLACLVWTSDGLRDPDVEALGALCDTGDPDACELVAWLKAQPAEAQPDERSSAVSPPAPPPGEPGAP